MTRAAVLFDVGNTLLQLDYARVAGVVRLITGLTATAGDLLAAGYAGRRAVEEALAAGVGADADRREVFLRALLAEVGAAGQEFAPVVGGLREEYRGQHLYSVVAPAARETLVRLAGMGYVVGAVSNSDGNVRRLLEDAGLADALEFIVDSSVVGIEKPDPRIFEIALNAAQVSAGNAWHVGDVYGIDVIGARSAGIQPILLDPLGRYGALDCRTVQRLSEIPELVGPPRHG